MQVFLDSMSYKAYIISNETEYSMKKSFIATMHNQEVRELLKNQDNPSVRLQDIAWPSESLAQLGPISVGECKRHLFYKILGIPYTEPMSLRGRHICDNGIMYEESLINRYKKHKLYVDEQFKIEFLIPEISNDIIVSGKVDVIINDGGIKKAIEIKSVSGFKINEIFGDAKHLPLPRSGHLMQAVLYKYYLSHTLAGKKAGIDEVYLAYVDRGHGTLMYFKIELDSDLYPIITAIKEDGNIEHTIKMSEFPAFADFMDGSEIATTELGRIAELRFKATDIFTKFDNTYNYVHQKALPPKDYSVIYTEEDLLREFTCGRISKLKYNQATKGKATYGDFKCNYCPYKTKCLNDSGMFLN